MTNNNDVFTTQPNYDLERAKVTLSAKLEESWKERRKQGGTTLTYIGGHIVIRLLNQAFNYQWSFEIIKEEIVPSIPKAATEYKNNKRQPIKDANGNQVWEPQPPVVKVLGRLTVPGLGVKEQYGSKVLIGGATEQESGFKSAATDALKKCASLFGIGLDLYGEAEGFEQKFEQEYQALGLTAPTAPVHQPYVQQPVYQEPPAYVQQPAQQAPVEQPVQQPVEQPAPQEQQAPAQEQPAEQYQTAAQAQESGNLATQQGGGGTALSSNPQEPQEGAVSAGARQFAWNPAEVNKMVTLKEQLGVTDNTQLNPYVREFLNNPEVTIQNITPENISAFNVFLSSKLV